MDEQKQKQDDFETIYNDGEDVVVVDGHSDGMENCVDNTSLDKRVLEKNILPAGATLQMGKYRIDKFLSSGGFGIAYMATNIPFDERVAVKEFFMKNVNQRDDDSTMVSVSNPSNKAFFDEQKAKFMKEARRLYSLHNPHIVHVVDLFEENGTVYYVMDYIDGVSLDSRVRKQGNLHEKVVRNYLIQILDALEVVHNQKMLHLDLKPANIMVDKKEQVYLIDFGASKQQKPDGSGATANSALTHTPGFAPLEQMSQEFENFGPWTDLYALGATLYNLLTSNKPPTTSKLSDLGEKAFQFPSSVSQEMRSLIFWLMKGRRGDRPQSVAEVREFLNEGQISQPQLSYDNSQDDEDTILNDDKLKQKAETVRESKPEQKIEVRTEGGKNALIAKVLPDNIGDIIYFDTTNENAEPPKTKGQYTRNKIITTVVVITVLATLYYLYRVYWWNEWTCGCIGVFTLLVGIGIFASQVFEGIDYFIGLKGFAVLKFKNERDNIVDNNEIKYNEFDYLLHEETDVYKNGVYQNTTFKYTIIKDKETKTKLYEIEGSYNNKDYSEEIVYNFAKNMETVYTNIRYRSMMEQYAKQGYVEFFYFGTAFSFSITVYANGDIKLGERYFKYGEIDSISCNQGNLIMDHHSKNDKNKRYEIEMGCIGNLLLLLNLLGNNHGKYVS